MTTIADLVQKCCDDFSAEDDFDDPVAIGLIADGKSVEWAILRIEGGQCLAVEPFTCVGDSSPLEDEQVALQLTASLEGWAELTQATAPAIADAVNRSSLTIEGDLPLFIRFANAVIDLVGCIGDKADEAGADETTLE